MANFVLVHGAWHGAWCWQRVVTRLQAQGHRVHAVTLTGLGERSHLLSPAIDLETHVQDVLQVLAHEELQDVVLAVHSYAGMIGTAVADRAGQRLKHLLYVDAVLPKPGESWSSTQASATQRDRLAAAQASSDYSFPPPDASVFGLSGEDHAWVARRQTPHPGHTYAMPLDFDVARVAAVPRTYLDCTNPPLATIAPSRLRARDPRFWGGAWAPQSRVVEMATGHDPMISAPQELTNLLIDCA